MEGDLMTVYAFYIKESYLSQTLKDYLFIDMDKDYILEDEIEKGVILYAWTKDKNTARCFRMLRSGYFYKMKLTFQDEHDPTFEAFTQSFGERELYHTKLASRNDTGKGVSQTVDIPMIITTFEAHHVDMYWEGLDDDLYEMFQVEEETDKLLYSIYETMKPEYQEALDILSYTELLDELIVWVSEGRYNNGILLDEYSIFMDTYSETF